MNTASALHRHCFKNLNKLHLKGSVLLSFCLKNEVKEDFKV
jgi:hypothetical protein